MTKGCIGTLSGKATLLLGPSIKGSEIGRLWGSDTATYTIGRTESGYGILARHMLSARASLMIGCKRETVG
jgi:hypothetical protein